MAGFFNGLLRKRAKASRFVYISWIKSLRKVKLGQLACMGPLASEITFAKKKIISRSKTVLVLSGIEF